MSEGRIISKTEFGEVFRKNYSRFYFCALDFVEDEETARDVVGDVTCDTWRRIADITAANPDLNLTGYMLNAIRNRSINVLRHKAVENAYIKDALAVKETIAAEASELHEERLQRLWQTMESMKPLTMQIFRMCWFEGKTYKETAEMLGLTVSLVHKHVSKAFAAFRKAFGVNLPVATVTILTLMLLLY